MDGTSRAVARLTREREEGGGGGGGGNDDDDDDKDEAGLSIETRSGASGSPNGAAM